MDWCDGVFRNDGSAHQVAPDVVLKTTHTTHEGDVESGPFATQMHRCPEHQLAYTLQQDAWDAAEPPEGYGSGEWDEEDNDLPCACGGVIVDGAITSAGECEDCSAKARIERENVRKDDVVVGQVYRAKVGGTIARVRIDSIRPPIAGYTNTHWNATNLDTNRRITIKSAQRLRGLADVATPAAAPKGKRDLGLGFCMTADGLVRVARQVPEPGDTWLLFLDPTYPLNHAAADLLVDRLCTRTEGATWFKGLKLYRDIVAAAPAGSVVPTLSETFFSAFRLELHRLAAECWREGAWNPELLAAQAHEAQVCSDGCRLCAAEGQPDTLDR